MASAENATDAVSRRLRPSRRDHRIESRQPSRRRSRPKWQRWRKSWNDSDRQRRSLTIKSFGQLQTAGLFPDDLPAIKSLKAELDQAKAASDESVPFSKRIRAGQNQIAMQQEDSSRPEPGSPCMKETSKRPTIECRRPSRAVWLPSRAWNSTEPKVEDIERALQERRNHLEQLHRQAAAEASHGAEATLLQIMFPDGITKHLPQEAKDSFKKATHFHEEERKAEAAAKEAAARPTKEAMELDEFGGLNDQEDPALDPTALVRNQASIDELLQARTRGDPERLAVLRAQMARDLSSPVPQKNPKQGLVPASGEPPRSPL